MGSGPIPASKKALKKIGWKISDLDLVESNEAFAAQSLAVIKDLGIPKEKVALLPNGSDLNLFETDEIDISDPIFSGDNFVAIFTGAHGIANGLDSVKSMISLSSVSKS